MKEIYFKYHTVATDSEDELGIEWLIKFGHDIDDFIEEFGVEDMWPNPISRTLSGVYYDSGIFISKN